MLQLNWGHFQIFYCRMIRFCLLVLFASFAEGYEIYRIKLCVDKKPDGSNHRGTQAVVFYSGYDRAIGTKRFEIAQCYHQNHCPWKRCVNIEAPVQTTQRVSVSPLTTTRKPHDDLVIIDENGANVDEANIENLEIKVATTLINLAHQIF